MTKHRKIVFRNEYFYHIYNRGIEKRTTFVNRRNYQRMLELLKFYSFKVVPLRYSRFIELPKDRQQQIYLKMVESGKLIDIVSFCLMPNHFHILLKQLHENGIKIFVSNISNSYTKYFNTKNNRQGSLFQGTFKAILVEDDEQLIHLMRYIHLNPVSGSMINLDELGFYEWCSHKYFLEGDNDDFINNQPIMNIFKSIKSYQNFIADQVDYAKKLELIKHQIIEK